MTEDTKLSVAALPVFSCGLAVSLGVDVRFFEKAKSYILGVQVFVQLATLIRIAAHAGYAVKYDSVFCLHGVKQFV